MLGKQIKGDMMMNMMSYETVDMLIIVHQLCYWNVFWSYLYICVAFDEVCSVWIREGLKKRKNGWSIFEKNVFFPLCGLGKKALPPSLPLIFSLFSVKFPLGRGSFRKPLSFYWINPINTRVHQNKLGSEMELKGSKVFIDHSIKI